MLSTTQRQLLVATVMELAPRDGPTEQVFKAAGARFACSSRTARRIWQEVLDPAAVDSPGASALAALASLEGLDPHSIYQTPPTGSGWWPDLGTLRTIAALPSIAAAHAHLARQRPGLPCYEHFLRRLRACVSPPILAALTGEGTPSLTAAEVYLTRGPVAKMTVVEMDSFEVPVYVSTPRRTHPIKPWILLGVDRGTKVTWWHVVSGRPRAVDARTLLALIVAGVEYSDGTVIGGVPAAVQPDNGGEFEREFAAGCEALGVEVLPIPPSRPHLKGGVERFGRTLEKGFLDWLPGAVHGPDLGPNLDQPWRDVEILSMEQFMALTTDYFARYTFDHPHGALGGYTPIQAWLADPTVVRTLAGDPRLIELLPFETRTVTKKGITFGNREYVHPDLARHLGTVIEVRYLPRCPDVLYLRDDAGADIGTAVRSDLLTDNEREQFLAGRSRRERYLRGLLHSSSDVRAAAGLVPDAAAILASLEDPAAPSSQAPADVIDAADAGGRTASRHPEGTADTNLPGAASLLLSAAAAANDSEDQPGKPAEQPAHADVGTDAERRQVEP